MMLATVPARALRLYLRFALLALGKYTEVMAWGLQDMDGRIAMTLPLERLGLTVKEDT